MNPTSVLWRDLAMGPGTDFRMRTLEGWDELPPSRYEKKPRTQGHGAHPSKVWSDERLVTVEGWCWSAAERDAQLLAFQRRMTFDGGEEPLTITAAGRTLTAWAQLITARPMLIRGEWGLGRFGWLVQWRCTDPRRYGLPRDPKSTGLPTSGGGLVLPMFSGAPGVGLDFGALGDTGQVTVSNAGTAPAALLLGVRGGLPLGFEVSAAGRALTYPVGVPSGQVLAINTGDGTVLVEGTASRRGNLTRADFMQVPAAAPDGTPAELTLQFTSLGGAYDAAAQLEVAVVDTYW